MNNNLEKSPLFYSLEQSKDLLDIVFSLLRNVDFANFSPILKQLSKNQNRQTLPLINKSLVENMAVQAVYDGTLYRLGTMQWLKDQGVNVDMDLSDDTVALASGYKLVGYFR